jgi:spermidine/putrescine transport system substrate-binding protein
VTTLSLTNYIAFFERSYFLQALAVFKDSKRRDLAVKFVQWVLSPEGQARLATSSCYWAMPVNSKAALSDEQKKILRWNQQQDFIANSYPYYIPDETLDAAMLDVWTEFLQYQPD